jgi:hypothetical protein
MITDEKINLKHYFSNSIVTPEIKQELIGYVNKAFNCIIATFHLIPDVSSDPLSIEFIIKDSWIPQQKRLK